MTHGIFTPALGATTTVILPADSPSTDLHFSCTLFHVSNESKVEIWTDLPQGTWHAVPFASATSSDDHFVASVALEQGRSGAFEYTFRIRNADGRIDWLGSEGSNGRIELVQSADDRDVRPSCPFDFGSAADVKQFEGEHSALVSYQLQDGVSGALESFRLTLNDSDWATASGLVIERSERIWYQPRILDPSNPLADVSAQYETQMLYLRTTSSAQMPKPRVVVLYPFSTGTVSSSIFGGQGTIWLRATRDSPDQGVNGHLAIAWGYDGELMSLVDRCVKLARNLLDIDASGADSSDASRTLDGLSACTWNALDYERYHLSDVLPWLEGLKDPQRSSKLFASALEQVLLDDGWQDTVKYKDLIDGTTDRRALRSFGVRPEWYGVKSSEAINKSPNGAQGDSGYVSAADEGPNTGRAEASVSLCGNGELKDAVSRIKSMGIKRVGVWMTIAGYWDGILPTGPIAERYGPAPLRLWTLDSDIFEAARTRWHLPPREALEDYYRTYFSTLRSAGVDFVKVDDQAHQDYLKNADDSDEGDSGKMSQEMLRAMRAASDEIFGAGTTIHCMAGSPRIWGGALALSSVQPKSIIRASDDFFPDQDDSHQWHIFVNTHNTLLLRSLNLVPDFDMAQAGHSWGSFHIPLRAFTPAATYSTDMPSTGDVLAPWDAMLARTKPGSSVKLLKPRSEIGSVLEGRVAQADTRGSGVGEALIVGLTLPESTGGHIGLWNCRASNGVAHSTLDARDVLDVVGAPAIVSNDYVLHLDGQGSRRFTVAEINAASSSHRLLAAQGPYVRLESKGVKIGTIAQLHRLTRQDESKEGGSQSNQEISPVAVEIACLGLLDKHVGLAAILSIDVKMKPVKPTVVLTSTSTSTSVTRQSTNLTSRFGSGLASSFPRPTASRLAAILLSHGLSPFRASASSTTSWPSNTHASARSLARDLWLRPIATVWSEARALAGFALAVVLWSLGQVRSAALAGPRAVSRQEPKQDQEQTQSTLADEDSAVSTQVLAIELLAVSARLGFYVAGGIQASSFQCTLDGHPIDAKHIKHGLTKDVIEVDIEAAWDALREGKDSEGKTWLLEVQVTA